jgi:LAGLIDADG DNA endonuclease family protein
VKPATEVAAFVAGLISAEGTFTTGNGERTFTCAVQLGATDSDSIDLLHAYFGIGSVRWYPRRQPHYDDTVSWSVRAFRDLFEVIVPFMDVHLPVSHKRTQYLAWRAALLDYWEHSARRRGTCTVEGCDAPHRAHGWCRHHLYVMRRE